MKRVLFVCVHNSARSQMAEALLRALKGDRYEAYSAGTEPTEVDPDAVRAMAEIGIDISGQRAKGLERLKDINFDIIVTLCDAKDACPFIPGVHMHRAFQDPSGGGIDAFRRVRDEIKRWIEETF
ncbi:arsenate reductase ArsC [Methanothrix sp.]|uniref:arsenate reductase ArsC n=1 Tax=Methanothrix sp. TaxID=90426 RepID=UPI002CCF6246|nr:arsenate reductase ArsC [Methanothrix sp.]HOK57407.1 arsenate reductase ArsC [Methanothrix sp.]HOL42738.1 arsenate reductase ArsC [Methanothrix sp.]HPO87693.1 arsenate reductase ArsC [Methanothrix sp.]